MPTTQCQQLIHNRWLVFREEEAGTDGQEVPARPQAAAPNAVHDLEVQLLCVVPCEDEEPAGLQEAADSQLLFYIQWFFLNTQRLFHQESVTCFKFNQKELYLNVSLAARVLRQEKLRAACFIFYFSTPQLSMSRSASRVCV